MTEQDLDRLVTDIGVRSARHASARLRALMPDLLYRREGSKTLAFLTALDAAADRAEGRLPSRVSQPTTGVKQR